MTSRRPLPARSRTAPQLTNVDILLAAANAASLTTNRPPLSATIAPRLLDWYETQPWQQDNKYIRSGYRPPTYSYAGCFQSLFYLHNESVNIHSHLLGVFLFFFIGVVFFALESNNALFDMADLLAFSSFFTGAVLCLGISSMYHLISNHSAEVARWSNQLDYLGIVLLIAGSFIPSVYYGFYCEPLLQRRYWSMIAILGLGCTIMTMNPRFRTPKWRPIRAALFVAMGMSAIFPVAHGLILYGADHMMQSIGLIWLIIQGGLYILGAGIYATRLPEKLNPGLFDIWGNSHQIFHVLILLAAASHFIGLVAAFHHAHSQQCAHYIFPSSPFTSKGNFINF